MTRSIVSLGFVVIGLAIFGNWFIVTYARNTNEFITDRQKPYTLVNPHFESHRQAESWLAGDAQVIGIVWRGQARAYPLAILETYELVNDRLGDLPILVWYYPPTKEIKVFSRVNRDRSTDREIILALTDQVSHDGPIALDKASGIRWNFKGESFDNRRQLFEPVPFGIYTWSAWRGLFPETTVLARPQDLVGSFVKPTETSPKTSVELRKPKGDEDAGYVQGE